MTSRNTVCRVLVIQCLQCSFVYCLTDVSFSQEQRMAPCINPICRPHIFSFGGTLKNNLHTLEELKNNITTAITSISVQVFHKVASNMVKRARACITEQEAHFEHCCKDMV
jgi:hypothetical protein